MLNNQENLQLVSYLKECAEFYNESIDDSRAAKFIVLLEHVFNRDLEAYVRAIDAYMQANNSKFPAPAQLGKYLSTAVDNKELAINAATRILECVKRFGSWNKELAHKELGDTIWKAVERFGGWHDVCNLEVSQTHIFLAQMRDTIQAMMEVERAKSNQPAHTLIGQNQSNLLEAEIA